MTLIYTILAILAALAFVGFFYSSIKGRKPSAIVSISQMKTKLQAERDWINVVAVFILPCLIVYNFFAWIAAGITAVAEFFVYIATKIRWVIVWLWNEVVIAIFYSLLKLAAHYIVVTAWKLFAFACVSVKNAYNKQFIRTALKYAAIVTGVLLLSYFTYILFPYPIVCAVAFFVNVLVAQFVVFKATAAFREVQSNNAAVSFKTFVMWLVGAACFAIVAFVLQQFAANAIVQSISITLAQIITPFLILFAVALVGASAFLPAFIAEHGEDFSIVDFTKAFIVRAPKYIVSLPFAGFGIFVATILPAIATGILYCGIVSISQLGVHEYKAQTFEIFAKSSEKVQQAQALKQLVFQRDSVAQAYEQTINVAQANLKTAETAKSTIKPNEIHTFTGNVYVSDTQFFTVPLMNGVNAYSWQISNVDNDQVILSTQTNRLGNTQSTGFSTIWKQSGTFVITLYASDGSELQKVVTVLPQSDRPKNESRPLYFATIDEANQAIANLSTEIEIAKALAKSASENFNTRISSMKTTSSVAISELIPWILASIGYALLFVLVLVMALIYYVIFFFDLYNYNQEPQYYFQTLYTELKEKNAKQPLLGIFVILAVVCVCCLHCHCCK
ncbi:MAG: hypothetical protein LBU90_00100 [Bacteroidales bacterium]|jgi:hypothetical protein|nr:hypothetical protein [Bacteroidales bacterium]